MSSHSDRMSPQRNQQTPPLAERLIALLGAVVVIAVIGVLGYYSVRGDPAPPNVVVRITDVVELGPHYLVKFSAYNRGDQTAAQVQIVGELHSGKGQVVEAAATQLDYVPPHSSVAGGLYFVQNPETLHPVVRATGYVDP